MIGLQIATVQKKAVAAMNHNTRQFFESLFISLDYLIKTWDAFQSQSQTLFSSLCSVASRLSTLSSNSGMFFGLGIPFCVPGSNKCISVRSMF